MNPKLTVDRLGRRAIVYIRQSSMGQVMHNHESQRRQYVDRARELGFHDVVVMMKIWGVPVPGWLNDRAFNGWWVKSAQDK